jgi:hypothetical protein
MKSAGSLLGRPRRVGERTLAVDECVRTSPPRTYQHCHGRPPAKGPSEQDAETPKGPPSTVPALVHPPSTSLTALVHSALFLGTPACACGMAHPKGPVDEEDADGAGTPTHHAHSHALTRTTPTLLCARAHTHSTPTHTHTHTHTHTQGKHTHTRERARAPKGQSRLGGRGRRGPRRGRFQR